MESPPYDHKISALFYFLFLILVTSLGLAIVYYAEPFLFWEHAFSDLGNVTTLHGNSNTVSRSIFSIGLIIESIIMFKIGAYYAGNPQFCNHRVKQWLAFIGAVGFLISLYPNDIYHVIHSIGIGMVIGALYLFTMIYHFELRPVVSLRVFYLDLILVQMVIFPYAVAFFVDSVHKQSLQKFCIMGVFFALLRIVSATEDGFVLREVIGYFRRRST